MFGNPVHGTIRPLGSPRIVGDPVVTRDCAGHRAVGQGCALDIGFARCGDPVIAIAAGKVRAPGPPIPGVTVGDIAQGIVKIDHADGSWSAYAHMNGVLVKAGQTVAQGQQIGVVGDAHDPRITNFAGCHLHFAIHLTPSGPEVDPWPLLNQTGEDMDPSFSPKPNRTVTVNKGARHRLAPTTADPANIAIASDPGGPLGFALMGTVVGEAVNGNAIWYAYWRPEVKKVYYLHTSVCGPETPFEATDCSAAVTAATKPLLVKIDAAKTALG